MKPGKAQADFEQAVAALARDLPGMAPKDACIRLAWLRRQAAHEGLRPAAMLADGLASAITRDGAATPLRTWLDALTLAAWCRTDDDAAGAAILATIGVRFAG